MLPIVDQAGELAEADQAGELPAIAGSSAEPQRHLELAHVAGEPPRASAPTTAQEDAVLFDFPHGLGDLIQFSIPLRHYAAAHPGVAIDVQCDDGRVLSCTPWERLRYGYHCSKGLGKRYRAKTRIDFGEQLGDVAGYPATKAYRCVVDGFKLTPRLEWFGYCCHCGLDARRRASEYLGELAGTGPDQAGRFPVLMIHYQGTSSRMRKDLPDSTVADLIKLAHERRRAVVVLDIERQSALIDQRRVFSPLRGHPVWGNPNYADPETVLALIRGSEAFVGIDSGPLHLAGATNTPTIGVWTHHHPSRYYDIAENVLHLVPVGHQRYALGPRSLATFADLYRYTTYADQASAVVEELGRIMDGTRTASAPASTALAGLKSQAFDSNYYREHLLGGLDYLGHGEWQRAYGRWLARSLEWHRKHVLDVGCACGSIMRGLGEAGVVVEGCDCSEYLILRGRDKWPDMGRLLHICDVANMHLWRDASWDGIHAHQVAEHWPPDLVPRILRELARVAADGALFFATLDTSELYERHGRTLAEEDPTHVCVQPLAWWHDQLRAAGWDIVTDQYASALRADKETFLERYDWPYWVARRTPRSGEMR